jgi:hypothetical protein
MTGEATGRRFPDGNEIQVQDRVGRSFSKSFTIKSPSIEVSALVASAIITLVAGEW